MRCGIKIGVRTKACVAGSPSDRVLRPQAQTRHSWARMDYRIADVFTKSLARLTADEQELAKMRRSICN